MESILLVAIAVLQVVAIALLVQARRSPRPFVDVSAKARTGALPGGTWAVAAGMGAEPVLESGVLVLDVRSTEVWVHEVWVRTDHGWVQLQPGAGEGMFRNALVSGLRLSAVRLWLAPAGKEPDCAALFAAGGLLVPAALFLARIQRTPVSSHRTVTPPPTA